MLCHELPGVASRIDMHYVLHVTSREQLVHFTRARVEAVVVLVAAVDVNLQTAQVRGARENKWRVHFPKWLVRWTSECRADKPHHSRVPCAMGKLLHQCGHMPAHCCKHLGIFEGKPQRALPAHGNPGHPPPGTRMNQPILPFHLPNALAD